MVCCSVELGIGSGELSGRFVRSVRYYYAPWVSCEFPMNVIFPINCWPYRNRYSIPTQWSVLDDMDYLIPPAMGYMTTADKVDKQNVLSVYGVLQFWRGREHNSFRCPEQNIFPLGKLKVGP